MRTYDENAAQFSDTFLAQGTPREIREIVDRFFIRDGSCIDVGCGSGRELNWLHLRGFVAVGCDVSEGMVQEARRRFPSLDFFVSSLPLLSEIEDERYDNVLCETVIMHLPTSELPLALMNLWRILKPSGVLSLSWRGSLAENPRENDGRLYSPIDTEELRRAFVSFGADVLYEACVKSASSEKVIKQIVLKKRATL